MYVGKVFLGNFNKYRRKTMLEVSTKKLGVLVGAVTLGNI